MGGVKLPRGALEGGSVCGRDVTKHQPYGYTLRGEEEVSTIGLSLSSQ